MGEDRRSGDRRSGMGDRRLDSSATQHQVVSDKSGSNNESKCVSLTAFVITILVVLAVMIGSIFFVYTNLNNKIDELHSHLDSIMGLDYEYDNEDYNYDDSYTDTDDDGVSTNEDDSDTSTNL